MRPESLSISLLRPIVPAPSLFAEFSHFWFVREYRERSLDRYEDFPLQMWSWHAGGRPAPSVSPTDTAQQALSGVNGHGDVVVALRSAARAS